MKMNSLIIDYKQIRGCLKSYIVKAARSFTPPNLP